MSTQYWTPENAELAAEWWTNCMNVSAIQQGFKSQVENLGPRYVTQTQLDVFKKAVVERLVQPGSPICLRTEYSQHSAERQILDEALKEAKIEKYHLPVHSFTALALNEDKSGFFVTARGSKDYI